MAYWLFKQEPSAYSYSELEKEGRTVWDGVANNLALKHLRTVKKGDRALFYHTGEEKQAVGIMEIASDPYSDPKDSNLVVVDVRPSGRLGRPVVRIPRLSVMPVPKRLWDQILKMGR
jgi:predicted RNA-binding protein with PUA-like domain